MNAKRRRKRLNTLNGRSQGRPLHVEPLEDRRMLSAVITVNSTADSNSRDAALTLREAILVNNRTLSLAALSAAEQAQVVGTSTSADADAIHFSIPGAGLHTISPNSALPTITDPVLIDGYTQAGASANSAAPNQPLNTALRIELAGNLAGADANGLVLGAGSGGSTIRGLAINRFAKIGVRIDGAGGNTIASNFIGTNATGTAAAANGEDGVYIVTSAGNTIGGLAPAAANLISGNTFGGVAIINTLSTGNVVQGNRIGVDVTGTVDLGNGYTGVLSFQGAGTIVGGTAPGAGNLISGNGVHGVWMLSGANNAVIQGNTIGTNLAGTAALGNSSNGILIEGATNAQIGGAAPGAGNVISASGLYGIFLDDNSHDAVIQGNLIGADRTGTQPIGGGFQGIRAENNSRATIGGLAAGEGNVIAKTVNTAITIQNGTGHMILGNKIGTDLSGALNLGNGGGVALTVGNSVIKGNVIAFNLFGLSLSGNTFGPPETGNLISQNSIHSNLDSIQLDLSPPVGPNFPQDATDADTGGANNLQNFPIITSVTNLGATTRVAGTLTSQLNSNYRLEFFASAAPAGSGFGPGQTFLGDLDLSIGAGGNTVPFSIDLSTLPSGQPYVTATATDITIAGGGPRNDTSEFSPAVPIDTVFIVTGTASGGTLPLAVGAANFVAGPQTISFNIPPTDPNHLYYRNDGLPSQVTRANIATTTAANDASILDIDPDWPHSWFSIELDSRLVINEQTIIDGYTQPGAIANTNPVGQGLNSVLRIEINGAGAGNFRPQLDGLIHLDTSNSVLRGLVVNRADGQSIQLRSGTGNTIAGNYIGADVSGTHVFRTEFGFEGEYAGVGVDDNPASSTTGNRIGGVTPASRNLLSGNSAGVAFSAWTPNNFVEGNLIGTNRAGTQALANRTGVLTAGGATVGGAAPGAGNVISGNAAGVQLGGQLNVIENNRIGTDPTGAAPVPNGVGIRINGGNNVVRGNTIAFSRGIELESLGIGVLIFAPFTGNLLSQNSIFSNGALGVDLNGGGVTLNDVPPLSNLPDQDSGANNLQNFPTLTSALPVVGGVQVQGTLASTPNSNFRIEFFANRERDEDIFTLDGTIKSGMFAEGETYLGFVAATTNASGLATFTANLPALPPDQDFITATATDVTNTGGGPRNNTSEFSPVYPLGGPSTVVTKTGDVGVGTLREAIFVANLTPGDDTVTFNIPANDPRHFYYQNDGVAGRVSLANIAVTTATNDTAIAGIDPDWPYSWFSIQPMRDLPVIADTIAIDGYTQPGSSPNTLPEFQALNTVLKIELDGTHGAGSGLRPQPNGEAILNRFAGLAINRWADHGIELEGTAGNVVAGNFIGADISGTLDVGNGGFGVSMHDGEAASTIGGLSPADRNLISGNDSGGVNIFHTAGINVQGNLIGPNRQRELTLGNHGSGVVVAESFIVSIGGIDLGAGNVIGANSGDGLTIDPAPNLSPLPIGDEPAALKIYQIVPEECEEHLHELVLDLLSKDSIGASQNRRRLSECLSDFVRVFAISLTIDYKKNLFPLNGNSPGLAVDLGGDGVTPNDLGDDDLGPNNLQNYPVLAAATTIGGATTIVGSLNSNSDSSYRIEFYSNTALDPSGYGEGETYLGFINVTTNADGDAGFSFAAPTAVPVGSFITSTATRLDDETLEPVESSEFSLGRVVTANATADSADFDIDGDVDGNDFLAWQRGLGRVTGATRSQGDSNADGDVDAADLAAWKAGFGGAASAPLAEGAAALGLANLAGSMFTADSPFSDARTDRIAASPLHAHHAMTVDAGVAAAPRRVTGPVARPVDRSAYRPAIQETRPRFRGSASPDEGAFAYGNSADFVFERLGQFSPRDSGSSGTQSLLRANWLGK